MNLRLVLNAKAAGVKAVTVNGATAAWKCIGNAVNLPQIQISAGKASRYDIQIVWDKTAIEQASPAKIYSIGNSFQYSFDKANIIQVNDPQGILAGTNYDAKSLHGTIKAIDGVHTLFVDLKQGDLTWWMPLNITVKSAIALQWAKQQRPNSLKFSVAANTDNVDAKVIVNEGVNQYITQVSVKSGAVSDEINVPIDKIILGSNTVKIINSDGTTFTENVVNWNIQKQPSAQELINLSPYFNDKVTNIFKNRYLSPRPTSPTLQLPWQGIGNWCYPLVDADIDDAGLRKAAGTKGQFNTPQGLSFATPGKADARNIIFTSQWDNYPKQVELPLSGQASHAYLMMAGSTNPMQSRLVNGEVIISYTDNTADTLSLRNPQTWWPIEQDYEDDGYAFTLDAARPIRVYLKEGIATTEWNEFKGIKGYASRGIDGGAGTILDLALNKNKTLKSLTLKAIANDVVIGLMGLTLVRE